MKILYINKVSPRLGGGAETRYREIGARLVEKNHTVYMVCAKTEPDLPVYEEVNGIKIHYVKTIPDFIFKFKKLSFYLSRYFFYFLKGNTNIVYNLILCKFIYILTVSNFKIYLSE